METDSPPPQYNVPQRYSNRKHSKMNTYPLHDAARRGDLAAFCTLLRESPETANALDSANETPLMVLLNARSAVTARPEFYLALHEAAPECFTALPVISPATTKWLLYQAVCSKAIPSVEVVKIFMDALAATGGSVIQGMVIDAVYHIVQDIQRSMMLRRERNDFLERLKVLRMLVEAYPATLAGIRQQTYTPIKEMLRAVDVPGRQIRRALAGEAGEQYCDIICRMAEMCPDAAKHANYEDKHALYYVCKIRPGLLNAPKIAATLLAVDPDVLEDDVPIIKVLRDAFPAADLAAAVRDYATPHARLRAPATIAWESRRRIARAAYEAWKAEQTA